MATATTDQTTTDHTTTGRITTMPTTAGVGITGGATMAEGAVAIPGEVAEMVEAEGTGVAVGIEAR